MLTQYAIDPLRTVAFSGFRTDKLLASAPGFDLSEIECILFGRLQAAIRYLYRHGYDTYLTGMAAGFDLLAAESVLSLKKEFTALRLIGVVPGPISPGTKNPDYRRRYDAICLEADHYHVMGKIVYKSDFLRRNDLMLAHSAMVICYYDGQQTGGTRYTVGKALKQEKAVLNVNCSRRGAAYNSRVADELLDLIHKIRP